MKQQLIDLLNDDKVIVDDKGSHITFNQENTGNLAVVNVKGEYCEFYQGGYRKAMYPFPKGMMIVALRRAITESI